MLQHIRQHLSGFEGKNLNQAAVLDHMRELGLNDFSEVLWNMPLSDFPGISAALPKMAPLDVQASWTGASGYPLLVQSTGVARTIAANYIQLTGTSLKNKKILDYGCGYGRLMRILRYFSDDIWGVDPSDDAIRHCHAAGIVDRCLQSDYLPVTLPVPNDFDLVIAFSIFTHLSARAAKVSLAAMRKHVKQDAIACITIRPVEYWNMVFPHESEAWRTEKQRAHDTTGFAFWPHNREPVDGEVAFGDTSMTLEWLANAAEGWKIAAVDRTADDGLQRYVLLRAV